MSVNKVILIGNVGQDPRVKYFDTGSAVATFPLATTDRGYTLANGTQIPERTEWHNIVASNRLAEIVDKYVHKGDKRLDATILCHSVLSGIDRKSVV